MNKKTVFSNFETPKKKFDHNKTNIHGHFMNEFGEDIISEVVQNEIHVKAKNKKVQNEDKKENNSSKN
jgi:hypothetical protein